MQFYFHLISSREQHDGQNPSLVTRAHQMLDKTRDFSLDHRPTFRSDSQPTDLVVENALLRQQLIVLNRQVKRPQLTNLDRFRLVFLSRSR